MIIVLQTLSLVDGYEQWSMKRVISGQELTLILSGVDDQQTLKNTTEIHITITTNAHLTKVNVPTVEDTNETTLPKAMWVGSSPTKTFVSEGADNNGFDLNDWGQR